MEYTRRELALAYLNAHPIPELSPADPESFAAKMKTYHEQMLRGLKQLFGVDLESDGVLRFFFNSVAHSYRRNSSPLSGVLEGGLVVNRVDGTGILEICDELSGLHRQSQERLVDLAEKILGLIKPDSGEVFTTEDLEAIGVDDLEPSDPDFDWY